MSKLTFEFLKKEICKRDDAKGTGYDLRANHVSACIKHLEDILAENVIDAWEGRAIDGMTLLAQFEHRVIGKARKMQRARIPSPKRTVTTYSKSKRPTGKKGKKT